MSGGGEWTVAQVLSHLGSGAEITLGLAAAPPGRAASAAADANQAVWARWNALSPREQADGYLRAGGELDRAVRRARRDPAAPSCGCPWAFLPQPADADLFTGMRLNEAALHAWDVAVAGRPLGHRAGRRG